MNQVSLFQPIQTNAMPRKDKIKNMIWGMVNASVFRWSPRVGRPFKLFRVWLVRLFGADIDWTCSLHPKCKIEYPWHLSMGRYSSLGECTWVYAMASIQIGDKCCIGNDVSAKALVCKDVAPWTVVGGNPSKFIKKREFKSN